MPEGTNPEANTGAATQSPAEATAASILAEMGQAPATATKPDADATTDEAETSTATTDDADESETEEGDDSDLADALKDDAEGDDRDIADDDEAQDEEDDNELPELDAELAANPVLAKRWEQQQKGLQKLVDRNKKFSEENANLLTWVQALETPDRVADAYQKLGQQLAKAHGLDVADLIGGSKETPAADGDASDWEEAGFDSPGEYKAYQRALKESDAKAAAEIEKLRAELQPTKKEAERQAQLRAEAEKAKKFDAAVKKVAPKVIENCAKNDSGWVVTEAMVAEAVKNLPKLAAEPTKAVRMWFSDERAKHVAGVQGKRTNVPDMTGGGTVPEGSKKPPHTQSAADILAGLGIAD